MENLIAEWSRLNLSQACEARCRRGACEFRYFRKALRELRWENSVAQGDTDGPTKCTTRMRNMPLNNKVTTEYTYRTRPKAAVAVAISLNGIAAWSPIEGGIIRQPMPMPAMRTNISCRAWLEFSSSKIRSPLSSVSKINNSWEREHDTNISQGHDGPSKPQNRAVSSALRDDETTDDREYGWPKR